jgi:hypothetical protein
MDGSQFDAWTRRRLGLATGGMLVLALELVLPADSEAKHHKKKRCKKLHDPCKPGSKRKCCGNLQCKVTSMDEGVHTFCCKSEGKSCQSELDCCDPLLCCSRVCTVPEQCVSDRALKTNFGSVDAADMLARVRELPISTWNYTSDDPAVRHIGPMAQDFTALFGVGADDRHIHPLDGQGVALAAIQALAAELERLREENARLTARLEAIESESGVRSRRAKVPGSSLTTDD